jgi:hypothetical protein
MNIGLNMMIGGQQSGPAWLPSSVNGLLAEYKFNEVAGTALVDYSGHGNNGVLVGSPTLLGWGIKTASNKSINGHANTAATKTLIVGFIPTASGSGRYLSGVSDGGPLVNRAWNTGNDAVNPADTYTFLIGNQICATRFPCVMAIAYKAVSEVWVDGRINAPSQNAGDGTAVTWLGGVKFGGHWSDPACEPNVYLYALCYSTVLTAQQIRSASYFVATQMATRSVSGSEITHSPSALTTNLLAAHGNSLVANMTDLSGITPTGSWDRRNFGVGALASDFIRTWSIEGLGATFRPLAAKNVFLLWIGINLCYDDTKTIAQGFRSRWPGWKIVCMSSISHSGGEDANMLAVNASFAVDHSFADAFVDLTADSAANTHLCTPGAYLDTTYYTDGIHLTAAGYALMNPLITAAINSLVF